MRKSSFSSSQSGYNACIASPAAAKGKTISKTSNCFLNSPKKRTKLTILSKKEAQDSDFRSFFGRIEDTINCLRDSLTFTHVNVACINRTV